MERAKGKAVIFFDIKNAFDTIAHPCLMRK